MKLPDSLMVEKDERKKEMPFHSNIDFNVLEKFPIYPLDLSVHKSIKVH